MVYHRNQSGLTTANSTHGRSGTLVTAARLLIAVAWAMLVLPVAACSQFGPATAEDTDAVVTRAATLRGRWLDRDSGYVMVVAHRGCWHGAPENSIPAIEACAALGVDIVELDVRRTRDGVLVLMHDDTVDRMTDGTGRIADLRYADLARLRLRQGKGGPQAALTAARVPTLDEALKAVGSRMLINVDAKEDIHAEAARAAERVGVAAHVIIKRQVGKDDQALAGKPELKQVLAMPIISQNDGNPQPIIARQAALPLSAVELLFSEKAYLGQAVALIRPLRARVWVNTLRADLAAEYIDAKALTAPDAVWGALIDQGVSVIQTDEPDALIRFLKSRGLR